MTSAVKKKLYKSHSKCLKSPHCFAFLHFDIMMLSMLTTVMSSRNIKKDPFQELRNALSKIKESLKISSKNARMESPQMFMKISKA